jgi:hypothetical protein
MQSHGLPEQAVYGLQRSPSGLAFPFEGQRLGTSLAAQIFEGSNTDQPRRRQRVEKISRSRFLQLAGMGLVGTTLLGAPAPVGAYTQGGVALGVWNHGVPWDLSRLDAYTSQVGVVPQVVLWYQSWGPYADGAFSPSQSEALYTRSQAQVLTWEPRDWRYGAYQPKYSLRAIASGEHDNYIRAYAHQVRDWGRLLYIRLMHEMNGNWYPWGASVNSNTPPQFRSAWMHVVDIFRQEQVSNVRWVWCPNVGRPVWAAQHAMGSYYPGHDHVDWVGLDGYNYAGSRSMPWYSLQEVFSTSYEEITALATAKPLMVAETGSDESGGNKASWILSMKAVLANRFPKVCVLIWFNQDENLSRLTIDSSESTLEAYKMLAYDPYLQGTLSR